MILFGLSEVGLILTVTFSDKTTGVFTRVGNTQPLFSWWSALCVVTDEMHTNQLDK